MKPNLPPIGMRGMLDDPPVTVEKDGPRNLVVTFNVSERFVRLPLANQTRLVLELAQWFGAPLGGDAVFYVALKSRRIGWSDGPRWIWWEDAYVEAVARLGAA